jgi:hypothetical protein
VDIDVMLIEVRLLTLIHDYYAITQTAHSNKQAIGKIMSDAGYRFLQSVGEDTIFRKNKKT